MKYKVQINQYRAHDWVMLCINDLKDIPLEVLAQIVGCLYTLMFPKDQASSIITGYNFYRQLAKADRVVTCSHIHSTQTYKEAMINDLARMGYSREHLEGSIRIKGAIYSWNPDYLIRDENGALFPDLSVHLLGFRDNLDLSLEGRRLSENPVYRSGCLNFIAQDNGWQLDLPIRNGFQLTDLCDLLLEKSAKYLIDSNGRIIPKTGSATQLRSPWPDAYVIPVIIIGEGLLSYLGSRSDFSSATRIVYTFGNNEISFIVNKKLNLLHNSQEYSILREIGFCEENCLINRSFMHQVG